MKIKITENPVTEQLSLDEAYRICRELALKQRRVTIKPIIVNRVRFNCPVFDFTINPNIPN